MNTDEINVELRSAYRDALAGNSIVVPSEAYVYLYRMAGFHYFHMPSILRRIRERFI